MIRIQFGFVICLAICIAGCGPGDGGSDTPAQTPETNNGEQPAVDIMPDLPPVEEGMSEQTDQQPPSDIQRDSQFPASPDTADPSPPPESIPRDTPFEIEPGADDSSSFSPDGGATETVKAEAGVGAQGRSLDEYEGAIVTPAKAYFSVRERVIFEIQIPQAMQLYKATNGNAPRSHDEFMNQIIQANGIRLPELPPGQRYVYDPQSEELMVQRPR